MTATGKAKAEGARAVKATRGRVAPYVPPWALAVCTLPTALITHEAWGDQPGMTAAMGAASLLVTGWAYRTWGRRSGDTQNLAAGFAGASTGWITVATVVDPLSAEMVNAWALGGTVLAIMWNVRTGARSDESDTATDSADSLWDKVKRLKGVKTKKIEVTDEQVEVTAQLKGGEQTVADVQASTKHIAGALAVDEAAVQAVPVKGRADQVKVTIRPPHDAAEGPVLYPGPSHLGQSIAAAPLRFGRRGDGAGMAIWVVGCEENGRPLPHTLVTGMTGSGKTETVCWLVVETRTRIDSVPVIGDPAKFRQSFGDIADAIEVVADGPGPTRRLIDNIPRAIEYRAALLGKLGYKQWVPECYSKHGIPHVMLDVEEAADVVARNERFVEALRKARSVGFEIMASMQVAGHTDIPRKARGQFGNSLAHGVTESRDAGFALDARTLDAGADPTQWGNNEPGMLYAELVGVPREQWPIEGRAFKPDYALRRAILDATRPHWARLDEGTREILADGLDEASGSEQQLDDQGDEQRRPSALVDVEAEYGPVNLDAPIPRERAGAIAFGEPSTGPRMTTSAARRVFDERVEALAEEGRTEVTAADFADLRRRTGRTSRGWVYEQLERCVEAGRLDAGEGRTYRVRTRVRV